MIPALIAGGSALLGGLFQSRSEKKQAKKQNAYNSKAQALQHQYDLQRAAQQNVFNLAAEQRQQKYISNTEKERFKWLVKGAQSAGFNPLTVLGATGGAMGQSPSVTAQQAAGQTAVTKTAPLSQIGNSIRDAGASFAQNYVDPISRQTAQLQNQLLSKQIKQIDRENLRFGQTGIKEVTQPVKTKAGKMYGGFVPSTAWGKQLSFPDIAASANEQRTQEEGNKTMYSGWQPRPDMPTGGVWEEWYGDGPVTWAYSAAKFPLDVMWNLRKGVYDKFGTPEPWNKPNTKNPATVLEQNYRQNGGRILTYPLGGF